jgi:multiple sugar transport system substrate-binding protein
MRHGMRRLVGLAAVAAVGIAGAACSSDSKPAASGPITLTFWTGQVDTAAQLIEALASEYHTAHPDVTVKVEEGASPDVMLTKMTTVLGTDTFPDAAYLFGSDAAALARSPKVVDLTEVIKSPSVGWDDFWGSERQAATIGGRVVGFPAVVGDLGVIYNKKVFAAAGVAAPGADWTWADFRSAAKAITNEADSVFGAAYNISGTEGTVAPFLPMVWQQGMDVLSADGKTVGFDSPKTADALELLRSMAVDDKSLFLDQAGDQTESWFTNDKIGMMITGPWSLSTLRDAKSEYGVQVLPGYGGDHQTTGGQDLWMLFDHGDARRTQAIVDFISWLTQPAQDARWSIQQFNPPIRAGSKSQPEFKTISDQLPGYKDFVDNLDNAKKARPPIVAYPGVSLALGEQIAAVLLGQARPADALKTAVEGGNKALAESATG